MLHHSKASKLFTGIFAALLIIQGCSSPGEGDNPSLSLTLAPSSLPAEGGKVTATVDWSSCKWKISEEGEKIVSSFSKVYAGAEGSSGSTEVILDISANPSSGKRSTTVKVSSLDGKVSAEGVITQEGLIIVPPEPVSITVDPSQTHQSIDGWGAMNLGANWGAHDYWSEEETDLLMDNLGLNIMRVRISPNESEWEKLVPTIRYAVEKYGALVLASPWSMPASMKDNGSINGSTDGVQSHLKKESYADYALYLEKFASTMKEKGAPIYAVSVQNEPDWPATYEGCLWSADNHKEFLSENADKIESALVASGESMGTDHSFYTPALNDEKACDNLDIVAGHLYGTTPKSFSLVQEKGKRLWMTEHLLNESWDNGSSHWKETLEMVSEMNSCMLTGWNAYIWWYGRRYYSLIGDGEKDTSRGTILQRGYAFSQFSRYIKSGYRRIGASIKGNSSLEFSAYEGDGHTVLVIINKASSGIEGVQVLFPSDASAAKATCTSPDGNRYDLKLTPSGNKTSFTVPAESITTVIL
ncbi:MAG: hypothetical protein IJV54_06795 [Bacteroidales bacterium]|nr:hypothetical protein [Bacteroidales bacterium]